MLRLICSNAGRKWPFAIDLFIGKPIAVDYLLAANKGLTARQLPVD